MGIVPGAVSTAAEGLVEGARRSVVEVTSGGRGAGVLWPGGLVLTADHVVSGRRRRRGSVDIVLPDGKTSGAAVERRDPGLDLALLRLDEAPEGAARVGDSNALRVGELVLAVGHPWGQPGEATFGVVSGVGSFGASSGRRAGAVPLRYVRSDVALAPGFSGGPLLNARGEVVAINAMVAGGFAFSIPSNAASAWVSTGVGARPRRLGVGLVVAAAGLVVAAVEEGSPAAGAGILVGDVLPGDEDALREALAGAAEVVPLCVVRGGRTLTVSVRLGGAPESAA